MSARKNIRGGGLGTLQPKAHTLRHNRDAAGVNGGKVHVLPKINRQTLQHMPTWQHKGITSKSSTK
jgi:hypothetical protein